MFSFAAHSVPSPSSSHQQTVRPSLIFPIHSPHNANNMPNNSNNIAMNEWKVIIFDPRHQHSPSVRRFVRSFLRLFAPRSPPNATHASTCFFIFIPFELCHLKFISQQQDLNDASQSIRITHCLFIATIIISIFLFFYYVLLDGPLQSTIITRIRR